MAKDDKAAGKKMTKAQVVAELADKTSISKKDVSAVFAALNDIIKRELGGRGPGEFVIPDLLKLKAVKKPPVKEHQRADPFNPGKMMTVKAKPATKKIRATALKKLKDLIK